MKATLARIMLAFCIVVCLTTCTTYNDTTIVKSETETKNQAKLNITKVSELQVFIEAIIRKGFGEGSITRQVWRLGGATLSELLFELENTSDKPINEVFSTQELAAFEEWYNFTGKETFPPATEIYPRIIVSQITLSSNGQQFAWIEAVSWGPPNSTIGFAMISVVISDSTGDRKILYETSRHPNGMFGVERNSLGGLTWSPGGQKIVFVEGVQGEHRAKVVDVATGSVENLGESNEGGIFSSWSPDGTSIVMNSPDTLNIFSTTGTLSQKDITGSWSIVNGIDWSPDGKTIVFAASNDSSAERLSLYASDVDSKTLIELPLDENSSYEAPQWSPDGKLIAINARPARMEEVDKLLVYDIAAQKIVASLEGKRSSRNFYWADDSQAILLTRGSPPDTPRTIELFHWQENRTEVIPFPEGVEDGVAIGISSE